MDHPMDHPKHTETQPGVRPEANEEPPPLFSTWRRMYAAVIAYLAAFILTLYLFTEYFQILQ
jgi:hypothetical protein